MSVKVRISTPLRNLTGGQKLIEVDGGDIAAVLEAVGRIHPGFKERLCDGEGKVKGFINIYANDEDIRRLDDLDTGVEDGDEISIIAAVAGG